MSQQQMDWMRSIMDMLEQHLGKDSEVVLHDLSKEFDDTVVDVRNGYITGSRAGRKGAVAVGLELHAGLTEKGDRYNCISYTRDARVLRTSTVYFRDQRGRPAAAICIHTDITQTIKFENYLHSFNGYEPDGADSAKAFSDVRHMLESFLQQGQKLVSKPVSSMKREDKMRVLKFLDDCGVFLISKSNERVCEFLNISHFSLYNYLEQVRGGEEGR